MSDYDPAFILLLALTVLNPGPQRRGAILRELPAFYRALLDLGVSFSITDIRQGLAAFKRVMKGFPIPSLSENERLVYKVAMDDDHGLYHPWIFPQGFM